MKFLKSLSLQQDLSIVFIISQLDYRSQSMEFLVFQRKNILTRHIRWSKKILCLFKLCEINLFLIFRWKKQYKCLSQEHLQT
ncbi:unnamed protein product [Paramecium sonneborni]|uniref:Uncharacterized protein n=1 Tax=Paramecium sonneborni TaxID=65129 RepID=A0A8S1N8R5_9CILI|nr:unnamed protein product [Paramecium sonneborni]